MADLFWNRYASMAPVPVPDNGFSNAAAPAEPPPPTTTHVACFDDVERPVGAVSWRDVSRAIFRRDVPNEHVLSEEEGRLSPVREDVADLLEADALRRDVEALRCALASEAAATVAAAAEVLRLRAELADVRAVEAFKSAACARLRAERNTAAEQCSIARAECVRLRTERDAESEQRTRSKAACAEQRAAAEALRGKNDNLRGINADLRGKNDGLRGKNDEMRGKIVNLRGKNAGLVEAAQREHAAVAAARDAFEATAADRQVQA
eukprot:CAMPEP_0184231728 /NCGR_PEP_ID=MMETSP0976-20121227/23430_1 /TAXON_ID=483370 /ORGANISM="non described non described, Strain CCMP2097" /LENGTH=264 /DNA_ID=CAMNT_0026536743 /DNA_START=8 /DNA_END=798 /DNA_ORIENTATION=-